MSSMPVSKNVSLCKHSPTCPLTGREVGELETKLENQETKIGNLEAICKKQRGDFEITKEEFKKWAKEVDLAEAKKQTAIKTATKMLTVVSLSLITIIAAIFGNITAIGEVAFKFLKM